MLLSFLVSTSHAQDTLNYGKVKADTAFDCKNDNSGDPDFGIGSICNSKNEFELRLQGYSRPHVGSALIVLTWNKQNKWDAKKFERISGSLGDKLISTIYRYPLDRLKNYNLNIVFDTLKNNHVFTLPNQNELNAKGDIMDGPVYRITFKVRNNFRSYIFRSPESFLEQNPGMTELKNYSAIVKILYSLF